MAVYDIRGKPPMGDGIRGKNELGHGMEDPLTPSDILKTSLGGVNY